MQILSDSSNTNLAVIDLTCELSGAILFICHDCVRLLNIAYNLSVSPSGANLRCERLLARIPLETNRYIILVSSNENRHPRK